MGLICNLQHNITVTDPINVNCKLNAEHVTEPRDLWSL